MGSDGPNAAGTIANDDSVGTKMWGDVDNAKADNSSYAYFSGTYPPGYTTFLASDYLVKLVKGNIVSGSNYGDDSSVSVPSESEFKIYGGESDLWGISLIPSDVNNSNFGFVFQGKRYAYVPEIGGTTEYSNYLKFTDFGFSIPSAAEIVGVKVSVKNNYSANMGFYSVKMFYAEMTIYYELVSTVNGVQSVTGVGSITFTGV